MAVTNYLIQAQWAARHEREYMKPVLDQLEAEGKIEQYGGAMFDCITVHEPSAEAVQRLEEALHADPDAHVQLAAAVADHTIDWRDL